MLQGLELLVTVLLARNRPPTPAVATGVSHAELAAELVSLPSGLLAMVCEAIMKLKVLPGAAGVRARPCSARAMGAGRRGPGRRVPCACENVNWQSERADACTAPVRVGQGPRSPLAVVGPYADCYD